VVATALFVTNPVSTPRFLVGVAWGALAFAWLRPQNRSSLRLALVALVLGALFVLPLLNAFRQEGSEIQSRSLRDNFVATADFGMYAQVQTGIEYVDAYGFRNGRQFTGAALFFVPRDLWAGKPVDTGDFVHDALGYPEHLNESSPLWIELFVDGGWLLVIAGFVGYGVVSARIDKRLGSPATTLTYIGVAGPLIAMYQVFLLRGSALGSIPRFTALILLVFICCVRQRRASRPNPR
jgi:hypothetical protein